MALIDLGHDAVSLTGSQAGMVTDTVHSKAKIVEVRAKRIHEMLDRGRIVLVAGFQGVSTELRSDDPRPRWFGHDGRGPGGGARRRCCEIYTDVDGVYTADPRIVPAARKLDDISYDEMLELAASGAGVMQLRGRRVRTKPRSCATRPLHLHREGRNLDRRGG